MRIFFDYAMYNLGTIAVSREIPSGMKQAEALNKISIYPTPAHDQLFISGVKSPQKYCILNIFGQILKQGNLNDNNAVDVKFLNKGNYFIRFVGADFVQTEKFIKL
jgi:hypothetical protein